MAAAPLTPVSFVLTPGLCRSESEPEFHEQHWFWMGLNRRDPAGGQSWRWSDGLGVSGQEEVGGAWGGGRGMSRHALFVGWDRTWRWVRFNR